MFLFGFVCFVPLGEDSFDGQSQLQKVSNCSYEVWYFLIKSTLNLPIIYCVNNLKVQISYLQEKLFELFVVKLRENVWCF